MAEVEGSQAQEAKPSSEGSASEESPIDIMALTVAVERLFRQDLEIERERLAAGTRRQRVR